MSRVVIAILALLAAAACGDQTSTVTASPAAPASSVPAGATATGAPASTPVSLPPGCQTQIRTCMQQRTSPPPTVTDPTKTYTATVHTSRGDIALALDPKAAPVTVNNFVYLAQNHFYDGLSFHRVEPGFVVQGGDPSGDGTGGPGYKLPNETNPAAWLKGSVGMASSTAGVNGSQFFVLLGDAPHLASAGVFNHFGKVASGADVVAAIKVGDRITSITVAAQ